MKRVRYLHTVQAVLEDDDHHDDDHHDEEKVLLHKGLVVSQDGSFDDDRMRVLVISFASGASISFVAVMVALYRARSPPAGAVLLDVEDALE